jgi:hypothetical protein
MASVGGADAGRGLSGAPYASWPAARPYDEAGQPAINLALCQLRAHDPQQRWATCQATIRPAFKSAPLVLAQRGRQPTVGAPGPFGRTPTQPDEQQAKMDPRVRQRILDLHCQPR